MRKLMFLILASTTWLPVASYAQGYQEVRIVTPQPEMTIHNNNDSLSVEVSLTPALAANDQIALLLDNKAVAKGRKLHFKLTDVYRSSHTLQAQVVAADGTVLATSPQVVFYMWHASRLFNNRQQPK